MSDPFGAAWGGSWTIVVPSNGDPWISELSDGAADLLGYSVTELTQSNLTALLPSDELKLLPDICALLTQDQGWDGRLRLLTKSEGELVAEISAEVVRTDSAGVWTHGRIRDITERVELEAALQEREARLRALNEHLPLVMWTCDAHLNLTWIWGSGLAMIGLEENQLVGTALQEFLQGDPSMKDVMDAHLDALTGNAVSYEVQYAGQHFRCSVEPRTGPMGEITGIVGTGIADHHPPALAQETLSLGHAVAAPLVPVLTTTVDPGDEVIAVGPLTIDIGLHEVRCGERVIELTPTEFRLLVELARRPGRVLTREILLDRVWGHDFLGGGSLITMAIKRLRSKVESDPTHPEMIETVRGVGYRFRADRPFSPIS